MNFIAQRILDQRQASLRPPLGVVPPGAVSLALGEPDFAPPQAVIDATTQAVAQAAPTTRLSTALQSFAMPFSPHFPPAHRTGIRTILW